MLAGLGDRVFRQLETTEVLTTIGSDSVTATPRVTESLRQAFTAAQAGERRDQAIRGIQADQVARTAPGSVIDALELAPAQEQSLTAIRTPTDADTSEKVALGAPTETASCGRDPR